jgi:ligand-binding sensor domain-containing protein
MKRIVRIAFFITCILYAASVSAQRYPFHNLSVDDGLIQSQATCVAQDKMGFLWISTLGGLSRYDGNNFTNYTVRNGLLNNMIFALAVDSLGSVWIGSQSGVSQFNGKTFVHYNKQRSAVRIINNSQQIQIVSDTAWWRAQGEVNFITKGKIKYLVTPGGEGFVSAMLAEKDGLWIAKGNAIYHQYNNNWDTIKFALDSEQKTPNVTRILRDNDRQVWIATSAGLYKIEKAQLRLQTLDSTEQTSQILSMTQDKAGALWLGTNKGVIKVSGNTAQYYKKHNGLSDNSFLDMFTDAEGNVWMASDGQGIFRFSGTQFARLDETMGLPSAQVMSIVSNNRDSLFLGTYDAGLFVFKDGKISPLPFPSSPTPDITSLCYSHNSTLWIGTRGRGLWSFANDEFNQFNVLYDNFPSNNINTIYEDASHLLWIGFSNGAMVFDMDTFITVVPKNLSVFSFLTIGKDSTLIATEASVNSLQLYHAGILSDYVTNTKIDSSSVQCFIKRGDELWMGSSDNGVIHYNTITHKALFINKSNGLKSDFIYNIVADNDGNIWVGTGYGIHKIKIGPNDGPLVTFYGKAQGITGMESNINSVLKLQDGSIWFGTTNGALHYQPHTAVVSSAPITGTEPLIICACLIKRTIFLSRSRPLRSAVHSKHCTVTAWTGWKHRGLNGRLQTR